MPKFAKRQDVLWTVRMKDADTTVETKDGDLEVTGVISGGERDRQDEWVNQDTLAKQWDTYRRNATMMYMHSWISPIGNIIDYGREGNDSIARVKFAKGGPVHGYSIPMPVGFSGVKMHIDDIRKMVEQRVVKSFSIAFDADKVEKDEDPEQIGRLDVTDWYETSLVTIPAYRRAQILNGFAPDLDELVRKLAKYLGEERLKQWYFTGTDYNVPPGIVYTTTGTGNIPTTGTFRLTPQIEPDEDPAVVEALRGLDRALSSTPEKELSEAELAQLRRIESISR